MTASSHTGRNPKHEPRVALFVETSQVSGRDILKGIAQYTREHSSWSLHHEPRSLEECFPRWLENWGGQGLIASIQNPQVAKSIRSSGIPTVDVLGLLKNTGLPVVHVDNEKIAELAVEHFQERGFENAAYYGGNDKSGSEERGQAFQALWRGRNKISFFEKASEEGEEQTWENQGAPIADWLRNLPKPCGVFVCSDQKGLEILEAANRAGLDVPEELAVLGVDNDETLCNLGNPPLSSIAAAHDQVGYQAAARLNQLMQGAEKTVLSSKVNPSRVITRQSTETIAVRDPAIAKALQYIRTRAGDDFGVDHVVKHTGLSRSVLQRRFREFLGQTVHQQILKSRIQRARELITETDLSLTQIAERGGFKHQEYMGAVFKKHLGKTPAEYRRRRSPPGWTAKQYEKTGVKGGEAA